MRFSFSQALRVPLANPLRLLLPFFLIGAPLIVVMVFYLFGLVSLTILRDAFGQQTETAGLLVVVAMMVGLGGALVAPWLALLGYGLRVIRSAAAQEPVLPPWNAWFSLLLDGFAVLVTLALMLLWPALPLIPGLLALPLAQAASVSDVLATLTGVFGGLLGLFIFAAAVLLACLAGLAAPMVLLRLARHRSVLAAINPLGAARDIWKGGLDYPVFLVVSLFVPFALQMSLIMLYIVSLGLLTPLLAPVSAVLLLYGKLFSAQLLGQYWRNHLR